MITEHAVRLLTALGHPDRLETVRLLVRAGEKGLTAGEIAQHLNSKPSAISFHLSSLAEAGLVRSARESRNIRYFVDFQEIGRLVGYLVDDCCQGDPRVASCCR